MHHRVRISASAGRRFESPTALRLCHPRFAFQHRGLPSCAQDVLRATRQRARPRFSGARVVQPRLRHVAGGRIVPQKMVTEHGSHLGQMQNVSGLVHTVET